MTWRRALALTAAVLGIAASVPGTTSASAAARLTEPEASRSMQVAAQRWFGHPAARVSCAEFGLGWRCGMYVIGDGVLRGQFARSSCQCVIVAHVTGVTVLRRSARVIVVTAGHGWRMVVRYHAPATQRGSGTTVGQG